MVRPENWVIVAAPLALLACSSWADHSEPNENGATLLWWAAQVILTCVSLALSMHYEWESRRGSLATELATELSALRGDVTRHQATSQDLQTRLDASKARLASVVVDPASPAP